MVTHLGDGVFGEVLLAQVSQKTETLNYQNFNKNERDDTAYQNTPIYVVLKVLNTNNLVHKLIGI